jgi:hypothetical protein
MRRILSLLAMAATMAMMLALTAAPALAQDIPPPGEETPGNPQTPTENVSQPTPTVGKNCQGQAASNFLKGPGESFTGVDPATGEAQRFPGSAAQPVEFGGQPNFNGPATSGIAQSDTEPGSGNPVSDFQQINRETSAQCRAVR